MPNSTGTYVIVVVDDDSALLRAVSRALVQHDYHVITYSSPERVLEGLVAQGIEQVDLLVTDMDMGSACWTGWELVQEVRKLQSFDEMTSFPIILWSGGDLTGRASEGPGGADKLLAKPDIANLIANLRELLKQD